MVVASQAPDFFGGGRLVVLVNSNMTAVKADLADARRQIAILVDDRAEKGAEIAELKAAQ